MCMGTFMNIPRYQWILDWVRFALLNGQNMSKTYSVKAPVSSRLTHPLIKGVIKFSRIMRQCVWGAFLTGRDTEDFPLEQSHDDTLLSAFEPSDEN